MIEELTHRLVKLVRGALLPATLPPGELGLYGGWENKTELTGLWVTQVIHTVRYGTTSTQWWWTCSCVSVSALPHPPRQCFVIYIYFQNNRFLRLFLIVIKV